ncbi:MAG: hypothetical protein ACKPKO_61250, partial [Candidatus Fonsibacter sp.]
PLCGEQYRRASDYKNAVASAFVLQITDPMTGEISLILTAWPPSEDMEWLNKHIELQARDIQTPTDVAAWYDKSKLDLKTLIDREKITEGLKQVRGRQQHRRPLLLQLALGGVQGPRPLLGQPVERRDSCAQPVQQLERAYRLDCQYGCLVQGRRGYPERWRFPCS